MPVYDERYTPGTTGNVEIGMARPRHALHRVDVEQLRVWIEEAVAAAFDIEPEMLHQPTRGRARVALARQVAMYLAHIACMQNLTEVGVMFDRDRTTVAYACNIIENRRDDSDFDRALELLEEVVSGLVRPDARRSLFSDPVQRPEPAGQPRHSTI
ncbi:MAG: hypothetical protein RLZ98_2075 [Pseudomonadota bacterium]|jgi:chromosomal replication initiation ATPase DnaA